MSLPMFYADGQVVADQDEEVFDLGVSDEDVKHAKVLRIEPGEHIAVVDAAKDYFECEVVSLGKTLRVRVAGRGELPVRPAHVTLVQGLCKGDKMDAVVRHATELGVERIVPLACERSVVKLDEKRAASRTERWRAIARSAAMQSAQPSVPVVEAPINVPDSGRGLATRDCVAVCWEQQDTGASMGSFLRRAMGKTGKAASDLTVAVVVGPEGGLAQHEVDRLLSSNPCAATVSLGPSILRTETAGIVAPALAVYELGGLQ